MLVYWKQQKWGLRVNFIQSSHLRVTELLLIKIVRLRFPTFSISVPAFATVITQISDSAHQVC